uniref:Uncharacterized protein n=1 Tax=Ditylenchus dipsaci TaxID=166011 RepID=A0A915EJD0_9BILA
MLLKRIYEVANIQSHALDTKMIEMMYKQHNTNHPTNKKVVAKHPNKKVVIIGADETGLYAALQFFLAGFEVTLIGEKQPESENNHILVLNDKWIIQLHIFLGTKYSQILVDNENTSSYPSLIKVSSKRLQKAMLNRLEELTKYALENYKKSNNHFNQRLLDASKNHPNVQKWISGRVNTPLEIHLDAVATKVELVDSKHYLHVKNYKPILFDVLICMEEPKQIIRNMYIGIPNQPSITKDWLVAAWSKENHASKVLEAEFIEDWLEMKELEEFLDEKNFDENIKAEDAQWIRDDSKEKESSPTAVTMCSLIEDMRKNENFEQEYGFKVESDKEVTTEQPYFNVEKEGKKSNARVTNNGLITFEKIDGVVPENKPFYRTLMQAVLSDL